MPSTENPKVVTTMRIPKDVIAALDARADERNWSRTTLVNQILAKGLADLGLVTSVRVAL